MPRITDATIVKILQHPYFAQHTAMHLMRERLTLPDGTKLPLILPPCACPNCKKDDGAKGMSDGMSAKPPANMPADATKEKQAPCMKEAGTPGSGRELLEMHHEMIRVFRFLLEKQNLHLMAEFQDGKWHRTQANGGGYAPQLWSLGHPAGLPDEVVGMFAVTDPHYLDAVFDRVRHFVESDEYSVDDAVDKLGIFIELGVKDGPPDGSGFHDTIHEFLASREGKAARGAEMNQLPNSRFNDYFWGLHLWMDGQYGRLLTRRGQQFKTTGVDPDPLIMCTDSVAGDNMGDMPGM